MPGITRTATSSPTHPKPITANQASPLARRSTYRVQSSSAYSTFVISYAGTSIPDSLHTATPSLSNSSHVSMAAHSSPARQVQGPPPQAHNREPTAKLPGSPAPVQSILPLSSMPQNHRGISPDSGADDAQ